MPGRGVRVYRQGTSLSGHNLAVPTRIEPEDGVPPRAKVRARTTAASQSPGTDDRREPLSLINGKVPRLRIEQVVCRRVYLSIACNDFVKRQPESDMDARVQAGGEGGVGVERPIP
jgi:hypothetical protein